MPVSMLMSDPAGLQRLTLRVNLRTPQPAVLKILSHPVIGHDSKTINQCPLAAGHMSLPLDLQEPCDTHGCSLATKPSEPVAFSVNSRDTSQEIRRFQETGCVLRE